MTLYDICHEVSEIEEKLAYGEIQFSYDALMSALKPGHPADILDDILSLIGWDVFSGKEVELERVKEWVEELKSFKEDFKVKELKSAISHTEKYIKEQEDAAK